MIVKFFHCTNFSRKYKTRTQIRNPKVHNVNKISLKLIFLILAYLSQPHTLNAQWFEQQQAIMGTPVRVELWSDDSDKANTAIATVMTEMQRIDALMSPFKPDSELSRINRDAGKNSLVISTELFQLIHKAQLVSKLTGGVFDISFASVGRLYDYRKGIYPSSKEIQAQLPSINYQSIKLDTKTHSLFFTQAKMRIDLGGIAKGYAVDRAIQLLQQAGIEHALVSAGGDSRLLGDRHGRPWMIGIRHPRDAPRKTTAEKANTSPVVLPLSDTAISTSGDYERYFIRDGVRYHHIINSKTGRSAHASQSATVIGTDTTMTDALSTSVFILGAKKGIELINRLSDFDAVVIDTRGQVHYSDGLMPSANNSP